MPDFTTILPGQHYSRPALARLWGYASHHALSRGVVTPRGTNQLILFVTREKQDCLTQYADHIEEDILFWEGEQGHGNDERIVAGKDSVYLFYRERHHSDFEYKGRVRLMSHALYRDRPSKFSFLLLDSRRTIERVLAEIRADYGIEHTEKQALIKARIGQGLYRQRALELWQSCSVTGFTEQPVLIASHIKPWKRCDNHDRLNPFNSLVLVPTLDRLFDRGYIGFEHSGRILLSQKISRQDWSRIGIDTAVRLRAVPEATRDFLSYHQEYVFDLAPAAAKGQGCDIVE
jgi:hypothetical protein